MNRPVPHRADRGTALAGALVVLVALFGAAASYLTLSYGGYDAGAREFETVVARLDAERGLNLAIAEMTTGVDGDGDGIGNLAQTAADGSTLTTTAEDLGGGVWRLKSVARRLRANAAAEAVVEMTSAGAIQFPPRAAITSHGAVSVTGSIVIDGRDWNELGTAVLGPGTFGISSVATITNGGSAKVGGAGKAPAKPPPAGTTEPLANWDNGVDDDGDGVQGDEEFDGIDDDDDGNVDEDTTGYPTNPDAAVGLAPGTLKALAVAQGTYFASQAEIDAYIAANGGELPGGKIVYCEFDQWLAANFGSALNDQASIVVHHVPAGTAVMKNVHGSLKGLILSDLVTHLNGDFVLIGALMSFAPATYGNAYGNGNANVKLCTSTLGGLPAAGSSNTVRIRSWSRASAN